MGYFTPVSEHGLLRAVQAKYGDLEEKIALFITGDGWHSEFPIHVDGIGDETPDVSINLALMNCDHHSITTWYALLPGNAIDTAGGGKQIRDQSCVVATEQACFESSESRPFLFRSGVPHGVVNTAPRHGPRVMFVWRFRTLSWEESLQLLGMFLHSK
jgi:hypothetical protein